MKFYCLGIVRGNKSDSKVFALGMSTTGYDYMMRVVLRRDFKKFGRSSRYLKTPGEQAEFFTWHLNRIVLIAILKACVDLGFCVLELVQVGDKSFFNEKNTKL